MFSVCWCDVLASTRRWPNVVLMLAHRLRRWASIKPTLGQRLVLSGVPCPEDVQPRQLVLTFLWHLCYYFSRYQYWPRRYRYQFVPTQACCSLGGSVQLVTVLQIAIIDPTDPDLRLLIGWNGDLDQPDAWYLALISLHGIYCVYLFAACHWCLWPSLAEGKMIEVSSTDLF